jgi:hypothetical protein
LRYRRNVSLFALIAACAVLVGCAMLGAGGQQKVGKILVIGVDGICWETLQRWERAEANEDFEWFREHAYVGPLETIKPTKSPIIWTSVATGTTPQDHGIVAFLSRVREFYDAFGGQTPISSLEVRRYPFWEIIDDRPSYVVGWWATWPALPTEGATVSDKFYFWRDMMKHGKSCGPASHVVYPPELEAELSPLRRPPSSITVEEVKAFLDIPEDEAAALDGATRLVKGETLQRILCELPLLYTMDETYYDVSEKLLQSGEDNGVYAFYIRGPDIMGHSVMYCSKLYEDTAATPLERERYGESLTRYYAYTFARLRELVDLAGEGTIVLILSDHGFERPPDDWVRWGHADKPPGTIIALGGGQAGPLSGPAPSIYDVAPTVLWLTGHPAADDMPGRPLKELFPDVGTKELPRRPTYGVRQVTPPAGLVGPKETDEQMVELLRSLGYIE